MIHRLVIGVLLLNASLTVRARAADSHKCKVCSLHGTAVCAHASGLMTLLLGMGTVYGCCSSVAEQKSFWASLHAMGIECSEERLFD